MRGRIPGRNKNYLRDCKERGFTLLEALIALVVFALGLVALFYALNTGILASSDVESMDLALNIAQAKMEEIRNTSFASISSSGPTADPQFPNYDVTVAVSGADPKQAGVTVAWNVQGGSTNVTLTTLIANCSCY